MIRRYWYLTTTASRRSPSIRYFATFKRFTLHRKSKSFGRLEIHSFTPGSGNQQGSTVWNNKPLIAKSSLCRRRFARSVIRIASYIVADYVKVGINLGDPVFRGIYHEKEAHANDLGDVIQRALDVGCRKLMVTGSDLKESEHAVEIAKQYRTFVDLLFPRCLEASP